MLVGGFQQAVDMVLLIAVQDVRQVVEEFVEDLIPWQVAKDKTISCTMAGSYRQDNQSYHSR